MRTNTAPYDYQRKYIITDQLEKLCPACGGFVFLGPGDVYKCSGCGGEEWVEVLESKAEEWRSRLPELSEEEFKKLYSELERYVAALQFARLSYEAKKLWGQVRELYEFRECGLDEELDQTILAAALVEAAQHRAYERAFIRVGNTPPVAPVQLDPDSVARRNPDDEGSDNRPSTQWSEHGYY